MLSLPFKIRSHVELVNFHVISHLIKRGKLAGIHPCRGAARGFACFLFEGGRPLTLSIQITVRSVVLDLKT